ncbi:unnamed protein product [Linum trigynum]|uniref:Uncharacterized protein n=1 Tax=Linum trigynum TaxID=586398 RepID=A0AAV2DZK1_9ROSI
MASPSIGSSVSMATSFNVIVISPSRRWNVCVSFLHLSTIDVRMLLSTSIATKFHTLSNHALSMNGLIRTSHARKRDSD